MDAFIAILGTIAGLIVGAGATYLRDRAQWSREDATRWHEAKFGSYTAFLGAARESERVGILVAMYIDRSLQERDKEPASVMTNAWAKWTEANDVLKVQLNTLELVGSRGVRAAALELQEALHDLLRAQQKEIATIPRVPGDDLTIGEMLDRGLAVPPTPTADPDAEEATDLARGRLRAAFVAFLEEARSDLGTPLQGAS